MKLIPNFKQLLDNEKLPEWFSEWWEFDDTDAFFQKEYKAQYGNFPHGRLEGTHQYFFDSHRLLRDLKKIQTNLGCRRSKPTRRQVELQKMFYQQYDLALIEALCPLHTQVFKLALCREEIAQLQEKIQVASDCYHDGIKGLELAAAYAKRMADCEED